MATRDVLADGPFEFADRGYRQALQLPRCECTWNHASPNHDPRRTLKSQKNLVQQSPASSRNGAAVPFPVSFSLIPPVATPGDRDLTG